MGDLQNLTMVDRALKITIVAGDYSRAEILSLSDGKRKKKVTNKNQLRLCILFHIGAVCPSSETDA